MLPGQNEIGQWSFHELKALVEDWARARKIIPYATTVAQLMKAVSEIGELCDAEGKRDMLAIKDGVGDVIVCLINYCALHDIDIVECLAGAYDEIKDRQGHLMPDGTFVKES